MPLHPSIPSALVPKHEIRKMVARSFSAMYGNELPEYNRFIAPVKESNLLELTKNPNLKINRETITEEKHGAIRVPGPVEMRIVTRIFAQMGMFPVEFYDMTILGDKSLPMTATAFRPIDDTIEESAFRMFCSMLHPESIPTELKDDVLAALEKNRKFFPKFSDGLLEALAKAESQDGFNETDAHAFSTMVVDSFSMHKDKIIDFNLYSKLRKMSDPLADIVLESPVLNHLTPRALNIQNAVSKLVDGRIPMQTIVQGPPIRENGVSLQLNQIARIAAGEDVFAAIDQEILATFEKDPAALAHLKAKALRVELRQGENVSGYMARIDEAFKDNKILVIQHKARFGEIESRGVALTLEGEAAYNTYGIENESDAGEKKAKIERFKNDFPKMHRELHDKEWAYYTYEVTDAGRAAKKQGKILNCEINNLLSLGYIKLIPQIYNDFLPFSAAAIFSANLTTGTEGIGNAPRNATAANRKALEIAAGTPILSRHEIHKRDWEKSIQKVCEELGESSNYYSSMDASSS